MKNTMKPEKKDQSSAAMSAETSNKQSAETATQKEPGALDKLFEDLLKDMYGAEQRLQEAIPEMMEACSGSVLRKTFAQHLRETKAQTSRLEQVFALLGKEPKAEKCEVMEGLIKETKKVIGSTPDGSHTRDAGLIICAQKVEHYEIASYGSLVQVAATLGHYRIADILDESLHEEELTDQHLTEIAESKVNPMADEESNKEPEAGSESEATAS
jgi:ferritin-like metal-binding protein YciE